MILTIDTESEEFKGVALAIGWGSGVLAYIADDPDRAVDFELWLTSYIGMPPDYPPGATLMGSLHYAKHLCAHMSRTLGLVG